MEGLLWEITAVTSSVTQIIFCFLFKRRFLIHKRNPCSSQNGLNAVRPVIGHGIWFVRTKVRRLKPFSLSIICRNCALFRSFFNHYLFFFFFAFKLSGEQSETEQKTNMKHNTNISATAAFEQEAASFSLTKFDVTIISPSIP